MLPNIDNLAPLRADEINRVRDIYIPLSRVDGNRTLALNLQSAVAYLGGPHARRLLDPADADVTSHALGLADGLDQKLQSGRSRCRVTAGAKTFRAQMGQHAHGADVHLRVLPSEVPLLSQLDMDPLWRDLMLAEGLFAGGLVLIAAPHGQGKTTSASSLIATRLQRYGGLANTFEDPIELPLQGVWGAGGVCIQREVSLGDPSGFSGAMVDALRQYPATGEATILFIGEIMDAATALEAVKAAANGHLVVATMHGRGIEAALRRLTLLCCAGADNVSESSVRAMIAEVLRGVFHQRLAWTLDRTGWSAARVEGEVVWSPEATSSLADAIRSPDGTRLPAEVAHQQKLRERDASRYLNMMNVRSGA